MLSCRFGLRSQTLSDLDSEMAQVKALGDGLSSALGGS